uniref:Uncharacterized protein n=1 Tax=Oryza nivara TaxID=4536 RepID=A0A0E0G316_ORYNI
MGLSGREGSSPVSLSESIFGTRRITSRILSAAKLASNKNFKLDRAEPSALQSHACQSEAFDV